MAEENFLENPFYVALTKQHPDLYKKACSRTCVICIPRASSLPLQPPKTSRRSVASALIPRAQLNLHILRPSPLQALEEGLFECDQPGYSVKIDSKNSKITGYAGFGRNFTARILSEEKCYDEKSNGSFTLLVIDRPFGDTGADLLSHKGPPALEYSVETISSASCEQFLRDVLNSADADHVLASFKKSIEQLYRTYVMLQDYLDDLANKIRAIVTRTTDEIAKLARNVNRKDVAAALEVFGHGILYHKIFSFLRQNMYQNQELLIRKKLEMVKKPDSLDGLNISTATFPTAEEYLLKVSQQTSPLQQLLCISRAIQGLQEDLVIFQREQLRMGRAKPTSVTLSADDTLSLIIYVLSAKQIPSVRSTLAYITKFCWTIPDPSLQYALTTFEAAVNYLGNPTANDLDRNRSRTFSTDSTASADDWDSLDRLEQGSISPTYRSVLGSSDVDRKLRDLSIQEETDKRSPAKDERLVDRNETKSTKSVSPLDYIFAGLSYGTQK